MARREMFNRGDLTVTAAGAANFIADHAKQNHPRRAAYQDAHQRIKRAQRDGALPNGAAIKTDLLFGWALEHSDWQDLRAIPWLPRSVQVEVVGVQSIARIGVATAVSIPSKIAPLKALVAELTQKLEYSEGERARLQAELAVHEDKQRQRSAMASENGRRGGRGKSL
jgi:hypothetical protein